MTCNPLLVPDPPTGGWQAWCAGCKWYGPVRGFQWQARRDKENHQ